MNGQEMKNKLHRGEHVYGSMIDAGQRRQVERECGVSETHDPYAV